jgi:hypothetical protein
MKNNKEKDIAPLFLLISIIIGKTSSAERLENRQIIWYDKHKEKQEPLSG